MSPSSSHIVMTLNERQVIFSYTYFVVVVNKQCGQQFQFTIWNELTPRVRRHLNKCAYLSMRKWMHINGFSNAQSLVTRLSTTLQLTLTFSLSFFCGERVGTQMKSEGEEKLREIWKSIQNQIFTSDDDFVADWMRAIISNGGFASCSTI